MRGEVNEAIFAERGVIRRIAIGGEIADDPAVAGKRSDPPRLPVGRRQAVQVWQDNRIEVVNRFSWRFAFLRRRRTPARSLFDTIIGGGGDRVGEDYDAVFGGLSHTLLPYYRRQSRRRRHDDDFVIGDQRSVGDG